MKFSSASVVSLAVTFGWQHKTALASWGRPVANSCHQLRRMLASAVDVYDGDELTLPRSEVVSAIDDALTGEEAFVEIFHSSENDNIKLLKLTSDGASIPTDTSGSFEVVGNFVVDKPDVSYTVDCPEDSEDAVCTVHGEIEGKEDCGLVKGIDDDLKEECADVTYKVGLKFINTGSGMPHFNLLASLSDNYSKVNEGCPAMIMFEGTGGGKETISTKHILNGHDENILFFGDATFKALLQAESKVDGIPKDEYNSFDNTCVHYASRIANGIGFEKSNELLEFIGRHIKDNQVARMVAVEEMKKSGTRRVLFENDELWEDFVMENVHTQAEMVFQN